MIFYNYQGYFGKRKDKSEDEKAVGPVTSGFDLQKWQWHLMIEKLVKELNLKPTEVYEMNYIDCLNWLSMFNEKDKAIKQQNKIK